MRGACKGRDFRVKRERFYSLYQTRRVSREEHTQKSTKMSFKNSKTNQHSAPNLIRIIIIIIIIEGLCLLKSIPLTSANKQNKAQKKGKHG